VESLFYEGRYIVLREILPSDASLYFSWLGVGYLEAYRPGLRKLLGSLHETRLFLSWRKEFNPPLEIELWVYSKKTFSPEGVIGILGIDQYHRKGELVAIFRTLSLRERFEAFLILLCLGFNFLHLEKLFFLVQEKDTRFLKFLSRIGLQPEAYLPREGKDLHGERYGVYRFALFPEILSSSLYRKITQLVKEEPRFCRS